MEKIYSNKINTNSSDFIQTRSNTSWSGGTLSDISIASPDDNSGSVSCILTYKELSSFPGLETVTRDEAEKIVKSLYQLSMIAYQTFNHD